MKRTVAAFSVLGLLFTLCNAASAADYKFAGRVTSVPTVFSSTFSPGEIVSGHLTLSPLSSSSGVAYYGVSNFSANIDGHYPITSSAGLFDVLNNFGGVIDHIQLDVTRPAGLTAPSISGHIPDYFVFNLTYSINDLSSTDPLSQFVFNNPIDRSRLRFDVNDSLAVDFQLYDLSIVPEPSPILFSLGFISISLLGRWSRLSLSTRLFRLESK